jgi:hypothetical protein
MNTSIEDLTAFGGLKFTPIVNIKCVAELLMY